MQGLTTRSPRATWWNRVFTSGTPEYDVAVPVNDQLRMEFVPISCQHCSNAPCETACPTQAQRTPTTRPAPCLSTTTAASGAACAPAPAPTGCASSTGGSRPRWSGTDGSVYEYGYPEEYRHGRPSGVHAAGAPRASWRSARSACRMHIARESNPPAAARAPATRASSATWTIPTPR